MTVMQKRTSLKSTDTLENHFQGAVIDEHGHEIPITREMIKQACHELEESREALDLSLTQSRKRFS